MAFSDFKKISEVQEKFRIKYSVGDTLHETEQILQLRIYLFYSVQLILFSKQRL